MSCFKDNTVFIRSNQPILSNFHKAYKLIVDNQIIQICSKKDLLSQAIRGDDKLQLEQQKNVQLFRTNNLTCRRPSLNDCLNSDLVK